MEQCRFCNGKTLVKKGFMNGKQRYKCKNCGKHITENDTREKYDKTSKFLAFSMKSTGSGFRQIAKTLSIFLGRKIYYQTVIKWIEKDYKIAREEVEKELKNVENVAIIEIDELFTFFKKKRIKSEFGLLLTGTKWSLLRFTSDQERIFRLEESLKNLNNTK